MSVYAVYFSPCGSTRAAAEAAARGACASFEEIDFTLPAAREKKYVFKEGDLAFFALPVYAGRLPNKMRPFLETGFSGNGAAAAAVVTYGNRSYGDALQELRLLLSDAGFRCIAAAALPAEHSFGCGLAAGRPDAADLAAIVGFGKKAAEKAEAGAPALLSGEVPGNDPPGPYYRPLKADGTPAVFLKAAPAVRDSCISCHRCATVCPMGSIDPLDSRKMNGICIKCSACVKYCPQGARYFNDPEMLSHVKMIAENYGAFKENLFII